MSLMMRELPTGPMTVAAPVERLTSANDDEVARGARSVARANVLPAPMSRPTSAVVSNPSEPTVTSWPPSIGPLNRTSVLRAWSIP